MPLQRVFWRTQGSKQVNKNDTRATSLIIPGLKENIRYELVIKAGNRDGTSTLTEPLSFTLSDKYIISSSTQSGKINQSLMFQLVISKVNIIFFHAR